MRSSAVASDLLRSFLATNGTVRLSHRLTAYRTTQSGPVLTFANGESIACESAVLALGAALKDLVPEAPVTSVASPLLVVYPAVRDHNFARVTPFVERTITHIRHDVHSLPYSVIGGGFSSAVHDRADMAKAAQALTSVASDTFPNLPSAELVRLHWGVKTEWGKQRGIRNYCSVVEQVAPDVVAALPGKFSLCFTLANKVAETLGITDRPAAFPSAAAGIDVSGLVGRTRHDAAVLEYHGAQRRQTIGPPERTLAHEQHRAAA
jgi:hypothetical protein